MNDKKIILDLCGGTGAWSRPYKEAGYDVRLATLPDFDVTDWRYTWLSELVFGGKVYGILAAPPCTEFSVAKGNKPRDLVEGMRVVEACLKIIWEARISGNLKFWALENPRGLLRQFLGIPAFTFQHWQFGTPQIKPTDIWGYFNNPPYKVKVKPDGLTVRYTRRINGRGWGNPKCPPEYSHMNLNRAAIRAITPKEFAQAFFKANQ